LQDYKDAFYSELDAFKERIKKRAQEKIEEALEEERRERLGPGGLDPAEVSTATHEALRRTEGFLKIFFGGFLIFFVLNSALLHLSTLRFHCADGCWDRKQDRCNSCISSQTL
jgi:hypothetical protein